MTRMRTNGRPNHPGGRFYLSTNRTDTVAVTFVSPGSTSVGAETAAAFRR